MAKRRPIAKRSPSPRDGGDDRPPRHALLTSASELDPRKIALGLVGASVVYVAYYPSDSVAVEDGDALWLAVLALSVATITAAGVCLARDRIARPRDRRSLIVFRLLDVVPWLLGAWMMWAAVASSPPGNLRMATNEAWLWVSAAAFFTSARRLLDCLATRQALMCLTGVCAVGLAVHGLHQYFVSLPANRALYRVNPEHVLDLAGVDAPPGSAERMVFENRLFDGGPTGTFALANSLAAVLLVGVILSAGVLRFQWRRLSPSLRLLWLLAALLCASCLLSTRSRSAILALLAAAVLLLIASSRLRGRDPRAMLAGLAGIALMGFVGTVSIALWGNREWFEEAPASLAFRFQYWRSTWRMVLDRPLFGAGPGNFQSLYGRYREASATEQIAEPHNLFLETLAAGGYIALALLATVMVAAAIGLMIRCDWKHGPRIEPSDRPRWLWLGAVLSLLMIWLLGWASRQMPDLDASLFVVPTATAFGILLWPSARQVSSRDLGSILGVTLVALGVHLMVSGGWTVPGVAIFIWLFAAALTPAQAADEGSPTDRAPDFTGPRKRAGWTLVICGVGILAVLYTTSVAPVTERKHRMAIAAMAQSTGQTAKAKIMLERAAEADPWSPEAMLWLADFYRWKLILQADLPQFRQSWQASLQEARQRAGEDPAIYRMIGAQQLHLYQRFGREADLAAAAETFGQALRWSPSNQWMMAQAAVIASAQGRKARAAQLAQRAMELSQLGGNIERAISRQQVYVARPLGNAADRGPIRRPADRLLPEPMPTQ